MNDCSHANSLVPVDLKNGRYFCTKCGWRFLVIHTTKTRIDMPDSLRKKLESIPRGKMTEALEKAVKQWIKEQNDLDKKGDSI